LVLKGRFPLGRKEGLLENFRQKDFKLIITGGALGGGPKEKPF